MSTNDVPKNFDSCQVAEWHITLQIFGGPRCQFVNDLSRKDTWQVCVVAMLQGGHRSVRKKITGHAKWRSVAQTWPIVFLVATFMSKCLAHRSSGNSEEFWVRHTQTVRRAKSWSVGAWGTAFEPESVLFWHQLFTIWHDRESLS